jgi:hypothetical protein
MCAQVPRWNIHLDPYAQKYTWEWEQIAHTEAQAEHRQAVWWSDVTVALVLKAALGSLPPDPATAAQALRAKTILTAIAGEGTMDIALLNAEHGIIVLEDLVLQQPWIQEQCEHFKVIIVISRGKQFITYFRHSSLLSGSRERDGAICLQELKARRPLTDPIRREEPRLTTRSADQPKQHLVIYTNSNKDKLAVIFTSPDQQQYEYPARA